MPNMLRSSSNHDHMYYNTKQLIAAYPGNCHLGSAACRHIITTPKSKLKQYLPGNENISYLSWHRGYSFHSSCEVEHPLLGNSPRYDFLWLLMYPLKTFFLISGVQELDPIA